MDENRKDNLNAETERDAELFDAIGKGKKRKKRRAWITAIVIIALIGGGLAAAVFYGQKKVQEQMNSFSMDRSQVVAYPVSTGSVNTTVSGSGQLSDVDTKKLKLPKGVKVSELLVAVGDRMEEGELLCTVEPSSVMGALAETQASIKELDAKLAQTARETVPTVITCGVNGRVKTVYAQTGDDVAACMAENGALAVLSLDGYMSVEVENADLAPEEEVKVVRADGTELKGKVGSVTLSRATVLVTDNGPEPDETVTVYAADGAELGTGALAIHNPMRITGYAGTVSFVNIKENQQVWLGNNLFSLKDTAYSANYESVLKDRRKLEEDMVELLKLSRAGGMEAPFTGTVSSIEWKDPAKAAAEAESQSAGGQNSSLSASDMASVYGAQTAAAGSAANNANSDANAVSTDGTTALLTLSPDEKMNVTISVDELNILTLAEGQEAQITVNTIAGEVFSGEVTEVNRTAAENNGLTSYSAVISMPKDARMLPGMSARVVVLIQGGESTITIPEEALHQTRDAAFVYTRYDYTAQEFGGAVAVVPGVSNGSMVEILEGLSEGDTVYYTQAWNPWVYASDGDADVWVTVDASAGNAWYASGGDSVYASDGDAE